MKSQVIEKLSVLVITAFGLVAALAWNEAIKAMFIGPCDIENAWILCSLSERWPWVYALVVTFLAVVVTIWIWKVANKIIKIDEVVSEKIKKTIIGETVNKKKSKIKKK